MLTGKIEKCTWPNYEDSNAKLANRKIAHRRKKKVSTEGRGEKRKRDVKRRRKTTTSRRPWNHILYDMVVTRRSISSLSVTS